MNNEIVFINKKEINNIRELNFNKNKDCKTIFQETDYSKQLILSIKTYINQSNIICLNYNISLKTGALIAFATSKINGNKDDDSIAKELNRELNNLLKILQKNER